MGAGLEGGDDAGELVAVVEGGDGGGGELALATRGPLPPQSDDVALLEGEGGAGVVEEDLLDPLPALLAPDKPRSQPTNSTTRALIPCRFSSTFGRSMS